MTPDEWLTSTDPTLMLEDLQHVVSDRKLRLFACSCCRVVWHLLPDARACAAVEVAEQFADGTADADELLAAAHAANEASYPADGLVLPNGVRNALQAAHLTTYAPHTIEAFIIPPARARPAYGGYGHEAFDKPGGYACLSVIHSAHAVLDSIAKPSGYRDWESILEIEFRRQTGVARDIFGNPFHPVAFDPRWRTEHSVGIAAKMYDERDFAAMPILADALQEAGCENEDILTHCRESGLHVSGCWVVDSVLGKG